MNENDNSAIRDVIECYDYIAEQGNCAIHLWHHTRKGNGLGASVDSARGIVLRRRMQIGPHPRDYDGGGGQEAEDREPSPILPRVLWQLNFAPPIENSHWFYLNSVPILNGDCDACYVQADGGNGGDNVGVIERWSLPKAAELTPENIDTLSKKRSPMAIGARIFAPTMWVGKVVAQILGLDPERDNVRLRRSSGSCSSRKC